MRLLKFEIELDDHRSVFSGDDKINGQLTVLVPHAQSIKVIFIVIKGEAQVEWEESNGRTKILHFNKERYIYQKIILYKADYDTETLEDCEHTFCFTFKLPNSLPGSFEGICGHVRYEVQAQLERRWHSNVRTAASFQVRTPLDLNSDPSYARAVEATLENQFWCLFCMSRPVCISLHLSQRCLVPGQEIKPSVRVANHSNVNIRALHLQLIRTTTYYDSIKCGGARYTEAVLARKLLQGEVYAGITRTWRKESFPVPAFQHSNLRGCSIIKQQFYLKLCVTVSGLHAHFCMHVPLEVGDVPLRQS